MSIILNFGFSSKKPFRKFILLVIQMVSRPVIEINEYIQINVHQNTEANVLCYLTFK